MSTEHTALAPKKLGLLNAVSINMSNMVGTGPFITVPAILATMGGPQALFCWFLGAVIAIADGLVFVELGTTFPSSGGSYNYLRESFGRHGLGRLMAWLFVWQFLFSGTLEIASSTVGMALYTGFLFKGLVAHPWAMRALAASFSLGATLLLYRKITDIARIMYVLWGGLLVTSLWVVVEGALHLRPALLFDFPPGAFHFSMPFLLGMGNGTMLVMFNFLGYYNICHLGDEVEKPERVFPWAILGSILLVLVLDLAISIAFTGTLPWREMIRPNTVMYDAVGSVFMQRAAGFWAGQGFTVMVLLTAFASTYSLMLGYSRIPYAAALDGTFFRFFAKTPSQQRLSPPLAVAGGRVVSDRQPLRPGRNYHRACAGAGADHVCRANCGLVPAALAPSGEAATVSHVVVSRPCGVRAPQLAIHLSGTGARTKRLALHALRGRNPGERRRFVPAAGSPPRRLAVSFG